MQRRFHKHQMCHKGAVGIIFSFIHPLIWLPWRLSTHAQAHLDCRQNLSYNWNVKRFDYRTNSCLLMTSFLIALKRQPLFVTGAQFLSQKHRNFKFYVSQQHIRRISIEFGYFIRRFLGTTKFGIFAVGIVSPLPFISSITQRTNAMSYSRWQRFVRMDTPLPCPIEMWLNCIITGVPSKRFAILHNFIFLL